MSLRAMAGRGNPASHSRRWAPPCPALRLSSTLAGSNEDALLLDVLLVFGARGLDIGLL